ncbi:ervatamin-B-like [Daphnia pulicaria]|uniref:ervatamin-B-like n=1 Tax=Daphnia pulicaria TaxID=35523 RepID=UPI001EECE21F|nr:ervatamin-B-like [Daphnia pulicaria]
MKLYLAILLVILAVAVADKDDDFLWKSFKLEHRKNHPPEKELSRKKNFLKQQRRIEKHNRENNRWKMAHSRFSDMTDQEKSVVRGARMMKRKPQNNATNFPDDVPRNVLNRPLPNFIDYRANKCLQPIRNQGHCGSCWAFSAITALEFSKCKKTGVAVSLSEQMLIDCDNSNSGCGGGDYTRAWQYAYDKGGAMTSTSYPYVSGAINQTSVSCKFNSTSVAVNVASYDWTYPYPNATVTMTYLQNFGPLPTTIKVLDSLFNYASGVYSDPACIVADENDVDHAVVIVGYGTTAATATVPATPYWIVRNTWGTGWGLSGYFFIRRGVNMCNIESWTAYVRVV